MDGFFLQAPPCLMVPAVPGRDSLIQARHTRCGLLLGLLMVSSCASFEPAHKGGNRMKAPRATLLGITAPRRAVDEDQRMPSTPAGQLRRAWLNLQSGQTRQSVNITNRLLYDRNGQPPSIRSLAFYVRGQAFLRQKDTKRAREDLRQASSLAIRTELQQRCARDLALLDTGSKLTPRPRKTTASPRLANFRINTRSNWKSAPAIPSRLDRMNGIARLTIHHSANIARSTNYSTIAATIRSIQHAHISNNGWGDIGYHFLIDPAGRIWQGRHLGYQGAHAGGVNNHHNIGICLLGKFTGGGQAPNTNQVRAMTDLVQWLRTQHRIPGNAVLTHKEIKAQTLCPGSKLQAEVNRMRRRYASNRPQATSRLGLASGGGR
jgi:hypothetical protein